MEMVRLIGLAPDMPPTTPGVMTACANMVPTEDGFAGAPSAVAPSGVGALIAPCRGGAVVGLINGTRRIFAGTAARLYELSGSSWVDVSRGGAYTGGADSRWSLTQFGNVSIAANDAQVIQASNGSGAFADIAGAPIARVVFSVGDFVMALNTSDGTFGDQGDRWWCCGIFNHATWAPSITTQANSGRLVQGGGDLLAGLALGKQAVAYKAKAMFLGTYVGGEAVWQWEPVPGEQGVVGPEAVCDANGLHVFVGEDNIWVYDGVRAQPFGQDEIRQFFFDNSSPAFRFRTVVRYERQNNRVWIFFPGTSTTDGTPDTTLVVHMGTRRWGRADRTIQAALDFIQPGLTYDTLNTVAATMDGLPNIPFDSQFWLQGGRALAVFDGANQLRTYTGGSTGCSFTTGDLGDDQAASYLSEARIRFVQQPTSASVTGQTYSNTGGPAVAGGSSPLFDGAFHLRQSARWHRLTFTMTGPCVFTGLGIQAKASGRR